MGLFDSLPFGVVLASVFVIGTMLGVRRLMRSHGETQARALREMAESLRTLHRQQNETRTQLLALAAANAKLREELDSLRGRPEKGPGHTVTLPPKPRYLN